MKKEVRIKKIIQLLKENTEIDIHNLSKLLNISRESIRRDLVYLEDQGLLTRNYGRAKLVNETNADSFLLAEGLLSKEERQKSINKLIQKKSKIRIAALAEKYKVTQATIRSDINDIKEKSNILKNHGVVQFDQYASVRKTASLYIDDMTPDDENIAARALRIIKPGETIYLDNSIYSYYIALHIGLNNNSVIITNSQYISNILTNRKYSADIYFLSGRVDYINDDIIIQYAESLLEHIPIQKAFIGFYSFHSSKGFYVKNSTESINIEQIITNAQKVVICLRNSDIEKHGPVYFPIDSYKDKFREIITNDIENEEKSSILKNSLHLPVSVCGSDYIKKLSIKGEHKIGFIYTESNSYYAKTVRDSIEEAVKSHENMSLLERPISNELSSLTKSLDSLIDEEIEVLIVYISNFELAYLLSEKCANARFRIISVDVSIPNSIFFGVHNTIAGKIGGRECGRYITEKWSSRIDRIIILEQKATGIISGYRISSMLKTLGEIVSFTEDQVIHLDLSYLASSSSKLLEDKISGIIGKRNVFLSFNEKSTSLIHPVIENLPKNSNNILVGHNYNSRIKYLMDKPESPIIGCITYHPESYGVQIFDIVEKYFANQPVDQMNYTNHIWIPNVAN